jgi:hypothetical protein
LPSADNVKLLQWLDRHIEKAIQDKLNEMGIPRLFVPGVVKQVTTDANGNHFADVYLNGSTTASTNIPVNPDIAANITANTPVWVVNINFNNLDMYVLARKLA